MNAPLREVLELLGTALDVSPEAIDPDADLSADLSVDSLSWFTLVVELEMRHGVQFNDDDAHTLTTPRLLSDYLDTLIHARARC